MKKIAFICELIGTERHGGEQHAMVRMADSIRKLGNEVDTYYYLNMEEAYRIKTRIPMKLRLLPFVRDMFFVPFIGRGLLKKIGSKYDSINASSSTIAAFCEPRAKLVITCHIIRSQKFETLAKIPKYRLLFNPLAYALMSFLERRSFNNADGIIVTKEHMKKFLTEKFFIPHHKITIVPNSVDTDLFSPKDVSKKDQVIFVGRGTIPKGLDLLLEVSNIIDANILVVTSKIEKNLLQLAKSKSNVIVKMHATPEDLVTLYSESKVFTLPSLDDERQTLSAMEAMSCGLPVVVTDKAGGDITVDGINGFLVDEGNKSQLAESIIKILNDDGLSKEMGKRNRAQIIEKFHSEQATTSYLNVLK